MTGIEELKRRLDRLEKQQDGNSVLLITLDAEGRIFHGGEEISAEEYQERGSRASTIIIDNIQLLQRDRNDK